MLTRKMTENQQPVRQKVAETGLQKTSILGPIKTTQTMRKPGMDLGRRAAFGDLTNAVKETNVVEGKKKIPVPVKPSTKLTINNTAVGRAQGLKKKDDVPRTGLQVQGPSLRTNNASKVTSSKLSKVSQKPATSSFKEPISSLPDLQLAERTDEDFSFIITEDTETKVEESLLAVDLENYMDVFNVGIYAQHIFDYYKNREKMFHIPAYLNGKLGGITASMRSILVDWMVEVQENFELNHETLYLAVKLVDMTLSRTANTDKEILQLIGAVSIFIAAKFDERCPPLIDDFLYICDNAFDRDQFIAMEIQLLKTVDFDLGIPISYTFLRRYAKVARMSIETLTLARFILEMSLMEYSLVEVRDSKLAAAALFISQKMRKEGSWDGDVVKSSGYTKEDVRDQIVALNKMLHARPIPQLSTIRSKYSHQIFHEVAKIALVSTEDLLRN